MDATDSFCDDILLNVLLRLPARILHERMRFVCKQWFRIISDSSFAYAHLDLSGPGVVLQNTDARGGRPTIILDHDGRVVQQNRVPCTTFVLGSCNGILLLGRMVVKKSDTKYPCSVAVYNPVTRRRMSLPLFSIKHPSGLCGGICFDPSLKAYKVVVLFCIHHIWGCKVLTLGDGHRREWKSLCDLPPFDSFSGKLCFIGGSLYWANHDTDDDIFHIISMNVCDEKFCRIEVDDHMVGRPGYAGITVMEGGKLAITLSAKKNCDIETWVLEDKLWTKRFTIPYYEDMESYPGSWNGIPTGIGNICGEEVMFFVRHIYKENSKGISYFTCNLKNGIVKRLIGISSDGVFFTYSKQHVHVGSLVSW